MSEQRVNDAQRVAQSALATNAVVALRDLTVERCDQGLLISGSVTSFYHKQLAQEAVRSAVDSVELVNCVRVH